MLAVAPKSDYLPIIAGMLLSTAVSFAVGSIILKFSKGGDDYDNALEKKDAMKAEGKQEEKKETIIDLSGKVIKKYMWHVMQEWDLVLWEHLFLERK